MVGEFSFPVQNALLDLNSLPEPLFNGTEFLAGSVHVKLLLLQLFDADHGPSLVLENELLLSRGLHLLLVLFLLAKIPGGQRRHNFNRGGGVLGLLVFLSNPSNLHAQIDWLRQLQKEPPLIVQLFIHLHGGLHSTHPRAVEQPKVTVVVNQFPDQLGLGLGQLKHKLLFLRLLASDHLFLPQRTRNLPLSQVNPQGGDVLSLLSVLGDILDIHIFGPVSLAEKGVLPGLGERNRLRLNLVMLGLQLQLELQG